MVFENLRDIFQGRTDYISKYDLFGLLAQSAIEFIDETKEDYECNQLLFAVLDKVRSFVAETRSKGTHKRRGKKE